ncbi:MAG: hypothetical protein JWM47_1741 [Acidimicrobiales bacterium]|nr:hypothetical protein [Acidimicrobiales bacterium]
MVTVTRASVPGLTWSSPPGCGTPLKGGGPGADEDGVSEPQHLIPTSTAAAAADRRADDGVSFDRDGRRLQLGSSSIRLPGEADNTAVLAAYVELVGRCRGVRPSDLPQVRDIDLAALAEALDLEAADLVSQVQAALGAGAPEARRLVSRLRDHRLVTGIAAAALTATLAGTVAYGGSNPPPTQAPVRAPSARAVAAASPAPAAGAHATAGEPAVPGGPITETADGVGLIPALQVDANGVGLVPAASIERPTPGG